MVKRAEKSDGVYTGKEQLRFIEVASQLFTIKVSVSTTIFQAELFLFPLFLLSFYGKLSVRVSVQITLPFLLLS